MVEKSLVLAFLINFFDRFAAFFKGSFLKKIQDFFGNIFKKSSEKSFFVKFFTTAPTVKKTVNQSVIAKILTAICNFFAKIIKACVNIFKKSAILQGILWLYDNIFNISVRYFGLFLLTFALGYEIIFVKNGANIEFFAVAAAFFAAVLILINLSLSSIFKNSVFVKKILLYFNVDLQSNAKTIPVTPFLGTVFALFGAVCGIVSAYVPPMYVFAFIIAVCGIIAVMINFKTGVYIAAAAFPFIPTMAVVALLLLTFVSFVLKLAYDENFTFTKTNLDVFIALFALVMLISSITSFARASSIKIFMVYAVFMMGYFVVTNTVTSKKSLYFILSIMTISALGVALYGVYQYVFGFAEGTTWIDTEMFTDIETRVVSTFENPNVLGEYLLLMIPVVCAFVWSAPKIGNRFINFVPLAVLGLCMIFTYSRGNWLGLIAAAIIFVSFYDRKFIWFGIILAILSPLFMPHSIVNRFLSIGDVSDTSTSYRVYIWFGTIKMLKDYWFCGIGPGTEAFNMIYPRYAYASIVAPHSHNLYLQIIAENGILGILVFLIMIIVLFKDTISAVTGAKKGYAKAVCAALMAGMAGYLVQGAFDNVWYNNRIVMMFFMFLALAESAVLILRREEGND
ncbi:MAG: O-antigen ligase family protein [Clostridia bacterium]|nr:O-antigen ligase family protein [Clostridia bacterium]